MGPELIGAELMGPELPDAEGEGNDGPEPGVRVERKWRIAAMRSVSSISPASTRNRRFSAAVSAFPVLIISKIRADSARLLSSLCPCFPFTQATPPLTSAAAATVKIATTRGLRQRDRESSSFR